MIAYPTTRGSLPALLSARFSLARRRFIATFTIVATITMIAAKALVAEPIAMRTGAFVGVSHAMISRTKVVLSLIEKRFYRRQTHFLDQGEVLGKCRTMYIMRPQPAPFPRPLPFAEFQSPSGCLACYTNDSDRSRPRTRS